MHSVFHFKVSCFTFFVSVLLLVQGWGQVFSSLFESKNKP